MYAFLSILVSSAIAVISAMILNYIYRKILSVFPKIIIDFTIVALFIFFVMFFIPKDYRYVLYIFTGFIVIACLIIIIPLTLYRRWKFKRNNPNPK